MFLLLNPLRWVSQKRNTQIAPFFMIVIVSFHLFSCMEIHTDDAKKAYQYWAGELAPRELELLNGRYWESAHWSHEYEVCLKLKPGKEWWDLLIKENYLVPDAADWTKPSNIPAWFIPSDEYDRFKRNDSFDQGSRYFYDDESGICYIYEIQL